jgi:D-alanyl-D-alanine dipeptidase
VATAALLALLASQVGAQTQAPPVNTEPLPIGSDSLAAALLVDLRTLDSTFVVDARYAGTHNFTGGVLPGYEANRAFLRREAAEALVRVQRRLKTGGMGLKIFDGYRPVRATLGMVDWATRTGQLRLLDDGYIARYSRHNLGLAVDLTLFDLVTGTEPDMGTPFDTFSEAAHTANAEGRVAQYRRILVRAMESEGFKNYDQEWWHFSYDVPDPVRFDVPVR